MCKIMIVTTTKKMSQEQVQGLIKAAHKGMASERNGFGFAISGTSGVYGERFVNPKSYGKQAKDLGPNALDLTSFGESDSFGSKGTMGGGLMVHGRTSTNDVSLLNTHPLVNTSFALIHNGVVSNIGEPIERRTTNDTEFILEHYTRGGIERVSNSVAGYYACAALDLKTGHLSVFRDDRARLYVAWVEKYETYIFATTSEIVKAALKVLKVKASVVEAKVNFHATFDQSGTMLSHDSFEAIERSFGALDQKSLGYAKDEDESWRKYSDDIPSYREESWTFENQDGEQITANEFEALSYRDQNNCKTYRNGKLVA